MAEYILSIEDLEAKTGYDAFTLKDLRDWVYDQFRDEDAADIHRRLLTFVGGLDKEDAFHFYNAGWWRLYDAALPA